MVKLKVVDKISGKTYDVTVDTEVLCLGTQLSYWVGMSRKCYPMTPDRFTAVMRHVRPGFGTVYVEAYILPDTIRIIVADLVVISPGGVDIAELMFDIRLGEYGVTYSGNFMPLRFSWENLKCSGHTCVTFGVFVKEHETLRHVPILFEKEYVEWLRALLAKKPAETWEVMLSRLQIYETTLNRLLEELSKLADRNAYELAILVIQQARQLMSQLQPQQQQR